VSYVPRLPVNPKNAQNVVKCFATPASKVGQQKTLQSNAQPDVQMQKSPISVVPLSNATITNSISNAQSKDALKLSPSSKLININNNVRNLKSVGISKIAKVKPI
jgi:hypothetical protein